MLFILLLLIASSASLIGLAAGNAGLGALGTGAGLVLLYRRFYRRGPAALPPGAARDVEPDPPPSLDPELVRDAIRLCHPDVHPPERRELATVVTARLTALRDRR